MTFDFQDGLGPVPAHRHRNPDGNEGGRVADTARVESTCFIGPDARGVGKAQVSENARVFGKAQVFEDARVFGEAQMYGSALISEGTEVTGDANLDSGYFKNQIIWGKEKEESWRL